MRRRTRAEHRKSRRSSTRDSSQVYIAYLTYTFVWTHDEAKVGPCKDKPDCNTGLSPTTPPGRSLSLSVHCSNFQISLQLLTMYNIITKAR